MNYDLVVTDSDYPTIKPDTLPDHIPFTGSIRKVKQISGFPVIKPEPVLVGNDEPAKWALV